ncbi:MAG: NADPH-dependent glutamate synthase [Kiritimatiellae bacterium]|nr:NADPH-dependent glutamate synthase [Kiritimatiellia bacterium]
MDLDYDQISKEAQEALDAVLGREEPLKPRDRMAIPAQPMPAQPSGVRVGNMDEVALGYTEAQARVEAMRCLQCKNAPCIDGCPVRIDIPAFVIACADGDFQKAIDIIKANSLLPAICGRVCPQEVQCQIDCTVGRALKDVEKSVSIGRLERYVADLERAQGKAHAPAVKAETGKKVAVIGSGPASITVAADVRREGHAVTVFEAFHKPGGVMMYGIPEFRLPKDIVQGEIDTLREMGVEIQTNFVVGRTRRLQDLLEKDGYDAVFVGTGAGLPKFMSIPGENLVGVYSANEYLTRVNLMRAFDKENADTPVLPSRRTAVLGGGNVAMDAARCAVRMGAAEVHLVYRRTEKEMPARIEEIAHAKEEGVIFHTLENGISFRGGDDGRVHTMECLRYELGEPDDSGRRRPVPIKGSEFLMDVDCVIVAIGNDSNPLIKQTTPAIETNRWGNILVDDTGKTTMDAVYAGGDIVLGAATVILAMGEGRRAAASINALLG